MHAPGFLTFCSSDQSLLLFKFKIFILNTSLFTFYITLCISIAIHDNMHGYCRSTDLLSQAYIYMVERS